MRTADVVIAGAGIAGVAAAWQIAVRLGSTTTVLVDPRPPLSLTSDRPGANYRDWWPQAAMVALADRSIALTEGLLADGASFAMDRRGYLFVTADPAIAAGLPAVAADRIADGVDPGTVDVLGPADLAERFPHLAPELCGAVHARRAGSLDTVGLGRAILAHAAAAGVTVVRGEVAAATVVGGRIAAITVSASGSAVEIATERFVNAAGPFARDMAARLGADLELETILRQKVVVRDPRGVVPRDAPFTVGLDATDGLPAGVHVKPDTAGLAGADQARLGEGPDPERAGRRSGLSARFSARSACPRSDDRAGSDDLRRKPARGHRPRRRFLCPDPGWTSGHRSARPRRRVHRRRSRRVRLDDGCSGRRPRREMGPRRGPAGHGRRIRPAPLPRGGSSRVQGRGTRSGG